jgi:hypothetical protein
LVTEPTQPVTTGKRVKALKKRHEDKPDLESMDSDDDRFGTDGDSEDQGYPRAGFLQ